MTKATTARTVQDLEIMRDQDGVDQNLKKISEEGWFKELSNEDKIVKEGLDLHMETGFLIEMALIEI